MRGPRRRSTIVIAAVAGMAVACLAPGPEPSSESHRPLAGDSLGGEPEPSGDSATSVGDDSTSPGDVGVAGDGTPHVGDLDPPGPLSFTVVTFNTGSSGGARHDADPLDGYTSKESEILTEWYGSGLAWVPAVEQTTAYFQKLQPDIVTFQEIFFSPECGSIPPENHEGFVCESWQPGDLTVAQVVLGPGYQIACHLGKPDKCAAVRKSFGTFVGCSGDLCLDGLDGGLVEDCGNGSRIGRGTIRLARGGVLTLVSVHGTSGATGDDAYCRRKQVEQVFEDLGDGEPAANGAHNLIMGDFNTDPGRAFLFDESARRWLDFVGGRAEFQFLTDVGVDAEPTYSDVGNIDHVVSDAFDGPCWHPGVTSGYGPVVDFTYFDHVPAICTLEPR